MRTTGDTAALCSAQLAEPELPSDATELSEMLGLGHPHGPKVTSRQK